MSFLMLELIWILRMRIGENDSIKPVDERYIESNYWTIRPLSIIGNAQGDYVARATTDPLHLFAGATVEPCDRFADSHCPVSTPKQHIFLVNFHTKSFPLIRIRWSIYRQFYKWSCHETIIGGMFEGNCNFHL